MSNIRVTYTGLISFATNLISVITGLIFVIMVTRFLTVEEFGTWGLISGLIAYAVIISPVVCYWSTREVARKEKSGKTAITTNSSLSIIGISIYLVISYFVAKQSELDESIIIFSAILIPVIFLNDILIAIIKGWKTHSLNYGLLSFEISKILFLVVLVFVFDLGLFGVILTVFLAYIPSIIILFILNLPVIKNEFDINYIKKWFRLFWVPTYRQIPNTILLTDVVIFSAITGSVVGIAYFTAARTIGYLVDHTRSIAQALYPKLLEGGKQQFLQENLMLFLFLSFPLVSSSIVFAKAGLFLLNPIYVAASPVVIFLALRAFLIALNSNFFLSLQGLEKVDLEKKSSFKDYAKSQLMLHPTLQLIRSGIYFGILAGIFFLSSGEEFMIELISIWALIGLIVDIPLTAYMIKLVKKQFTMNLDWIAIGKYLIITILVSLLTYYLIENFLEFKENAIEFVIVLIPYVIFSITLYFVISALIERRAKILAKKIIDEINSKFHK